MEQLPKVKRNSVKKGPIHCDLFGKEITVGSFVVAELNTYRKMELCVVNKINPKMVRLRSIHANSYGRYYTANKYPNEMVLIENQDDITMYILKNSTR